MVQRIESRNVNTHDFPRQRYDKCMLPITGKNSYRKKYDDTRPNGAFIITGNLLCKINTFFQKCNHFVQ